MKKNVAIVHYNTPELTEAAILSVKKHGGEDYQYYVFDNSDARPFAKEMENVTVFDNTKGQIIDFDAELAKYPERDETIGCSHGCWFGSDKHMMSVQKLWDLVPEGFILMDSDILVTKNIDFMFMEGECVAGMIRPCAGPWHIKRLLPMLLWINVPMCKAGGAVFFDPDRAWALHKGMMDKRNWWDTGAALLDDIKTLKPQCHGRIVDIRDLMVHYGGGSWRQNDVKQHHAWLEENRRLWYTPPVVREKKYSVLTYIFNGYEKAHEIEEMDPEAEYILVTDDPKLQSDTWEVRYAAGLTDLSPFDKTFAVRYHPWRYVHTDTVVRIDGSIGVNKPLRPLVDAFEAGAYDRCLMIHPHRDTIPEEYDVWVSTRKYPREQADRCLGLMRHLGYDLETRGLYQGCFEIQRNNHVNNMVNDITFSLLRYAGDEGRIERLDQTFTSFVINHLFADRLKVMPVSEDIVTDGNLMTWYLHNSGRKIKQKADTIPPMLFNQPVNYEDRA